MSLYNRGSSYYSVINVPKMLILIEFSDLLVDEVDGIKYISINEHNGKKVKTRAGVILIRISPNWLRWHSSKMRTMCLSAE